MDSVIQLEVWFEEAHPGFLPAVLAARETVGLRGLARRWVADARPWARAALQEYIEAGCDQAGHRPLVKALYKAAEAAGDAALVGAFLVAFDRLVPRKLTVIGRWDWRTRESVQDVVLRYDPSIPVGPGRARHLGRFSRPTRLYLQRRALRFFRRLGYRQPDRFRQVVAAALARYADEHLSTTENLLDSWGLHHLLFGRSPLLTRTRRGTVLAAGASLETLQPAPLHPAAWYAPAAAADLLALVAGAKAALVRGWALALLRAAHPTALQTLELDAVTALLASPYEDAQTAGAAALADRAELARLPRERWLALLGLSGPVAAQAVCAAAATHVDPQRLGAAECVRLARLPVAPVARLGWQWTQALAAPLPVALPLTGARVAEVRAAAAAWLADRLAREPDAQPTQVRDLVDAAAADVRAHGLALVASDRFRDEALLWEALPETPYADVRRFLLQHIEARRTHVDQRRALWLDTLLALGSGSSARGRALRQIGDRLERHPEEAPELLRLLGFALRSVSAPDRRQALAVIVGAVHRQPALRAVVAARFPELALEAAA